MKKSKLLQNSKDMLSRSFNPAKCKTSLKLAASRLKLLKNKKEVQVRQMKRELAQLLESGNIQTARIRVEHVVREEKMMAAYDLIEIYCELVVARMPIIESQKNCPIDLKEAITSLVFASPRCGDVPELLDVRKHFTAKYGKEFTTAAIELRPECGVSRMLVEKLSAIAPDGQTKIKILSAIAEEHNVKWDPNSFGEKDGTPHNDLLSGPSTIENSSKMYAGAPLFEASQSQSPPVNNKTHSSLLNFSEQDPRSSVETQNSTSSQSFGVSSTLNSEVRPPVRDERVQSIHEDANAFSKQRWNMGFKDATSAAQAAAESAELASMAARAAAELSSQGRITRQYSTESHMSDVHISRHGPEKSTSKLSSENFPDYSANMSSGHSRLKNDAVDQVGHDDNLKTGAGRFSEDGYGSRKGFSQSASIRSKTSINDSLDHDIRVVEGYSQKNSVKEDDMDKMNMKKSNEGEASMKKQSVYDSESANGWHEKYENFPEERLRKQPSHISSTSHSRNFSDENIFANSEREHSIYNADSTNEWQEKSDNFHEERIRKQPGHISTDSHSSIFRDEIIYASYEHQKFGYDAGEDPLVGIGKGRFDQGASQTSPHDLTSAVFDKSDSDSDDYGFNMGSNYDEQETEVHFSSSGKKSPKYSPIKQDAWNPRTSSIKFVENSTSSLFFTDDHTSPEFPDNFVPVTFDDSDGPYSDSDEHMDKFGHIGTKDSTYLPSIQNNIPKSVRPSLKEIRSEGKQRSLFSDDKVKSEEHMDGFDPDETKDSLNLPSRQNKSSQSVRSSFKEKGYSGNNRQQRAFLSDDEVNFEEVHGENNQGVKFDAVSPKIFSSKESFANQPSPGPEKFKLGSEDTGSKLNLESGNGLNFGKLTGGFRHKGNIPPPYLKSRLDNPLSLKKKAEETVPVDAASPTVESSRLSTKLDDKKSMRGRDPQPDMDIDSSEEETSQKETSGHRQESYIHSAGNAVKKKSIFGPPVSVFGSYNSDSDEDIPKNSLNRKSHLQSGISRRTKASYPKTQPDSDSGKGRKVLTSSSTETPQESPSQTRNSDNRENLKQPTAAKVTSKPTSYPTTHLDSGSGIERKPSSSYNIETTQESRSQTKNSNTREILEHPTSAEVASKPMNLNFSRAYDRPTQAKPASTTMQESKISHKSSDIDQPSSSQPRKEATDSSENQKPTLSKTYSNIVDNAKQASHVHPKLPDYDTIAAKLLSLRQNRQ
ncbi:dentin sialophosphoprotein-like isoform X2 [Olea europaea var. sylvestris]|uniref:dentin sialophosphoprotein-like isoform X2 n=1 Tax=Olea europaea var. sylvestris TaxID=158386 RepID=UPI000C1D44EC|nr:dentin sialophosphoprotein-like isoform X2 [Olea europaea var. sylvestris]